MAKQIEKLSFPGEKLIPEDISNTAIVLENIVAAGKSDEVSRNINFAVGVTRLVQSISERLARRKA